MTGHNRQGVALLCDTAGVVRRVIHDDLDLPGLFVVGRQLMDITAPASAGALAAFLAAVSDRGAAFDREVRIRTSDQEIALYVSAVSEGDHLYLVAARSTASLARLHEDLILINNEQTNALRAALKELGARQQREMAKKNIELEQLNALKNELLGMAAHDLRSPLGVIQNYSEFLEADAGPLLNDEQRAFISTIKRTSRFMLGLVDDLLDVATIEGGRLTLDRQPCDPGRLLTENVTLNRTLAARKTIAIDWTAPERPLPTLQLDAGRIEQVLNNLIGNAMKFASPGSRVSVSATTDGDEDHQHCRSGARNSAW